MSAAAAAEHTCHGAIFCGQPRAAAERECPACTAPRPLLEVLQEHVDQVHAQRDCRCACHLTPTPKPGHICKAPR